jgi:hypothetical protein
MRRFSIARRKSDFNPAIVNARRRSEENLLRSA